MDIKYILSMCDHTLLSTTATWDDIKQILDDGIKYKTASACIPPCFIKKAKEYVEGKLAVCTVIGFPNGYQTTATKLFETKDALDNGADEIDTVINICLVKERKFDEILNELTEQKKLCGNKIFKVIIETCLLTDEEKIKMCEVVTKSGADYIKTSTGFSKGGATKEDVMLLRAHVGKNVKVKAAGGISSIEDAEEFIKCGADRLGTSRIVKTVKLLELQ
mgnify:FL=1